MTSDRILAESRNYRVISSFETVSLVFCSNGRKIDIGDFYGEPLGAFIDKNERFVAMYGCGLILYFLHEPFDEYCYDFPSPQWFEAGRNEPIMWVDNAVQTDDDNLRLTLENGDAVNICFSDKLPKIF